MQLRRVLIDIGVLVASICVALLLCEFGARMFLNPADYLGVGMVKDDILGAVLPAARATGFDKWGFRNRDVPPNADIIAIGDSHTYGNTAKMDESWPKVLQQLSGRNVYNMGMGGYGPNQYYYLLKTKALQMKPRFVICGLYLGDDFENAFMITYGLDHWAYLRNLPAEKVNFDIWGTAPPHQSWHKKVRVWLSEYSVIYQLAFHSSALGRLQGQLQIKTASQANDAVATLIVPDKHIMEAFLPKSVLARIDQNNPNVREGMRITFTLLEEMHKLCTQNHIEFLVVIIPTKEMVFADYLEHRVEIHLSKEIDSLLVNERLALEKTVQFLNNSRISHVDTLPKLKSAVQEELYARTAADMHPGKNGYRVIAQAVLEGMRHDHASK